MGVEILGLKMRAVLRRWGDFNFLTYIYFLGLRDVHATVCMQRLEDNTRGLVLSYCVGPGDDTPVAILGGTSPPAPSPPLGIAFLMTLRYLKLTLFSF